MYAAHPKNIHDTWVGDVKVGKHNAFFGIPSSGWSDDGLGLAWLHQAFERFAAKKVRRKY
jgi:hypothetical protein